MANDSPTENEGSKTNEMKITINPQRAQTLIENITSIRSRISSSLPSASTQSRPRLVAVSKLKPASDILALHEPPSSSSVSHDMQYSPQHHFGENYVQELLEKSKLLPKTINWHFIGGLQSNKCLQLARDVENLWAVESVDSIKKAQLLEKGRAELVQQKQTDSEPLRVFIQVNTSGEESKSGVSPDPPSSSTTSSEESKEGDLLLELASTITQKCPHLKLQGLMTIGAIARSKATTAETENEDFITLKNARSRVVKHLNLQENDLELSMGMSEDFEGAIKLGSTEVRVGSTIFGERPPKSEAKVV